ncbi:MAG: hypothetical protein H8E64_08625, partial [Candidatus Marinimicrobia bacterium]|nr:hypothetical protein [Candidatus Neomarinimicrobiota bacterium]
SQSNTYSLTVTVEAVNDAPVVTNSLNDIVVDENWSETITVNLENFFDDPDIVTNGDVLTYSFENTNPSLFEVTLNGAGIEVSITPEMNGSGELIITAEDNDNVTISDTMMVTVLSIMELDRNGIAFHATETSGEFIIQNLGDNPLYLTSTFEWTLTPNWLTMDVVQGEISAATDKHINVTVSPTGQAEGVWIYIYGYRDAEATDYVDTDTLYMSMDAWSDVGPVITNIQYSPTTPTVGSDDVTITGSIESANEVSSVELYYNNGTGFKSLEVVSGSAVIPKTDVTYGGLIFYIYALDNLGYETTTQVQFISVGYPSFTISQDTKVQKHTMISVPGELNNRSVASLLEDELGPYDPTQWRLFTWNGSSQTYDEHPLNLDIGTGYWLITDETHTLNGGAGTSTDLAGKILELTAGWNMIGNPYHFNINLSNLTLVGDVEANLYKHNGSGYDQTQDMNPGIGYWIWAGTGGSLVFNPGQSGGGTTSKVLDTNDQGWTASIAAFTGHVDDKLNIFGVHPDAQDEKDTRDYHEPPVIGNYIRVAFDNTGWETAPGQYSTDIRAENQDVKTWEMSVKTNVSGIVSLHGVDMANIPADLDAILVDLDYGSATDLRDSRPYRFTSNGGERTHPFAVIVGHPEDVEREMKTMGVIPNQFDLAQNTPNPFNPVTSIRLSLPEESNVSLTVFNLLGEEVARIAYHKAMEAGSYRMIWNGRTHGGGLAPSGVYLYMVDVQGVSGKHFRKTRKMILIK